MTNTPHPATSSCCHAPESDPTGSEAPNAAAGATPNTAASCHGGHPSPGGHAGSSGADVRDVVCGMTVAADSPHHALHAGHAGHAGHDYRFCSAGCRTKFVADPAKYLQPAAAPQPAPAGTR